MTWHSLAFNEEKQIGFGEYSFQMRGKYHGIVTVKLEDELVKFWREYRCQPTLAWEEFTRYNLFQLRP